MTQCKTSSYNSNLKTKILIIVLCNVTWFCNVALSFLKILFLACSMFNNFQLTLAKYINLFTNQKVISMLLTLYIYFCL